MVMKAVKDHFPPEFINRLDDTVVFQPLQPLEIQVQPLTPPLTVHTHAHTLALILWLLLQRMLETTLRSLFLPLVAIDASLVMLSRK